MNAAQVPPLPTPSAHGVLRTLGGRAVDIAVPALVVGVFLKNAWVADDAYINFRSIEQLFAGHGPVWNAHERVQVYTSPLWYWVLAAARLLSDNLYELSLAISLVLTTTLVWQLRYLARGDRLLWALLVTLLLASSAFFDFTSSGLENPLAYVLLAQCVLTGIPLSSRDVTHRQLSAFMRSLALLVLCRLDLATLVLPAAVGAVCRHWPTMVTPAGIRLVLRCVAPLAAWFVFALVYYGDPLPNTAYAKLHTGLESRVVWQQGLQYIVHTARLDPATGVILALAPFLVVVGCAMPRWLSLGVVFNVLYVVSVGGDFMQGRFLSGACLLSVLLLGVMLREHTFETPERRRRVMACALTAAGALAVLLPMSPMRTTLTLSDQTIHPNGIANERAYYFSYSSLRSYISGARRTSCFLTIDWGPRLGAPGQRVLVDGNIGYFGLCAVSLDQIVVDPLALSDPFLARLPPAPRVVWRIGHFPRALPPGYLESVERGVNVMRDPALRDLLDEVWLKTHEPDLLSSRRLRAIALSLLRTVRVDRSG